VPIAGVAQTEVGPLTVSTVFVRFDHRADAGDPLLFETVAFGADQASEYSERYCERASTWGDAEATDARAVAFAEAVWKSCIGS
jgi:hypothetical protein